MNAGDPRGDDEQHSRGAAAAGARAPPRQVSPPSRRTSHVAANGAAIASGRTRFRPLSPPASDAESGPAPKRAKKSYDAIKKEVQDLLEKNLMGTNGDAVKVETLLSLREHFLNSVDEKSLEERQEKQEYQRAVTELNGCQFVLAALRRELDDDAGRQRNVVCNALRFLLP
jgi:hypothetical protein